MKQKNRKSVFDRYQKLIGASLLIFSVFFLSSTVQGQQPAPQSPKITIAKSGITPIPFAVCSDMAGENGWGSWMGSLGYHQLGGSPDPTFFAPIAPVAPRFNITAGAGIDPCTPGTGGPPLPVVAPGFGNASIQLGQPNYNGMVPGSECYSNGPYPPPGIGAAGNGCSEQLKYPLTVGIQDTNFIYAYALILENPAGGHTSAQAPFAEIYILDANGDTVPCSHRKYMADLNGGVGPGFFPAACAGSTPPGFPPNGMIVSYKPWTMEGINLYNYVGQTLTVVLNNSDCALGGHFCYSFWDFSCGPLTTIPSSYCVGQSVTITAPSDPTIAYTYQWYQNGNPYTGAPSSTSQTIIPYPQPGDTFAVQVMQPSGCPFYITYVPIPMSITPNFTYTPVGGCGSGVMSFTDLSTTLNNVPVISWNWSFPGGSPANSTVQNPSNIAYSPGSYTVTLIVTSQNGCVDTISLPVVLTGGPPPIAAAITTPVCFNNLTVFTDQSTGNPTISIWDWNFGDGNTSTQQSPSHTYASAGTYTVTLIVTDVSGCKDTVTLLALVNPLPTANFSSPPVCFGDSTCFTDLSSVTPGTISTWNWNFGDPPSGAGNISTVQSPCHVYTTSGPFTVVLTVTSDSGCQNTVMLPAVVNPPPVAVFSTQNACLNSPTGFTDNSTPAPGDPISTWNWNFGDGSPNSTVQNPSHTYVAAGTYTITLIITSAAGCRDTVSNPVTLYAPPVANFSGGGPGCAPVCISNWTDLSTSTDGAINSWVWSFPGGSPSSYSGGPTPPTICYNAPGTYGASLIVTTVNGCKDTIAITPLVNVYPWPTAEFCVAPAQAPTTDPVFTFCDMWSSDVVQWTWNFGDNDSDNVSTDPVHSYAAVATNNDFYTYKICVNVQNQYGCYDSVCHTVELIPEFTFYIPNTVTPNGDYTNEFFFGKCRGVKEYNIWVFDRWGNMLWDCHKEDKNTNWDNQGQDGLASACKWDSKTVKGGVDMSGGTRLLNQEDVYVWKVRLTDIFGRKHTYVGHVSIVK